jgi:hypothetical protein
MYFRRVFRAKPGDIHVRGIFRRFPAPGRFPSQRLGRIYSPGSCTSAPEKNAAVERCCRKRSIATTASHPAEQDEQKAALDFAASKVGSRRNAIEGI